jgi:hypothetical protein
MWWTSFCLRIRGFSRTAVSYRPLCPLWLSALWEPKPPELIDCGRPKGKNKRKVKQQQLQAALEQFAKGPSLKDRLLRRQPSAQNRKFLLIALQIATSMSTNSIPNISLLCDQCLRSDLRWYKQKGLVMSTKLQQEDLTQLRQVLTDYNPQALLANAAQDSGIHQGAKKRLTVLYTRHPCNIQYELYSTHSISKNVRYWIPSNNRLYSVGMSHIFCCERHKNGSLVHFYHGTCSHTVFAFERFSDPTKFTFL